MIPTNDDLTLVIGGWPFAEFEANRRDIEGNYLKIFDLVPPFAERIRAARREARFVGAAVPSYFRKPFGPGWALVGDAAYNKDFITAQGITDAFRDAELCATALHDAFSGVCSFEVAMARYHAIRDQHVLPMYELTAQLAMLQPPPPELARLLAAVHGDPQAMDAFARVNAGVMSPAEFFSDENVARILAAATVRQTGGFRSWPDLVTCGDLPSPAAGHDLQLARPLADAARPGTVVQRHRAARPPPRGRGTAENEPETATAVEELGAVEDGPVAGTAGDRHRHPQVLTIAPSALRAIVGEPCSRRALDVEAAMQDRTRPVVIGPGGARSIMRLNGEQTVITIGQEETRGAYAVRENAVPAGFVGVPLHRHRHAEEAFYVLGGALAVYANNRWISAVAGSFVLIPRGLAHSIANPDQQPARWLTLISPAAQSGWIEAEHELLTASPDDPDPAALAAIHRRFGLEIIGPPPCQATTAEPLRPPLPQRTA